MSVMPESVDPARRGLVSSHNVLPKKHFVRSCCVQRNFMHAMHACMHAIFQVHLQDACMRASTFSTCVSAVLLTQICCTARALVLTGDGQRSCWILIASFDQAAAAAFFQQ